MGNRVCWPHVLWEFFLFSATLILIWGFFGFGFATSTNLLLVEIVLSRGIIARFCAGKTMSTIIGNTVGEVVSASVR